MQLVGGKRRPVASMSSQSLRGSYDGGVGSDPGMFVAIVVSFDFFRLDALGHLHDFEF